MDSPANDTATETDDGADGRDARRASGASAGGGGSGSSGATDDAGGSEGGPANDGGASGSGSGPDGHANGAGSARDDPRRPEPVLFRWTRSLDLVRRSGWVGGVCVAIAQRIGVDVVLVRGVLVVAAVLGAPVVLLYAAAWFLLPDEHGTIHAQELGHGRFTRVTAAVAALVVLSFLPLAQGFWYVGAAYWGDPDIMGSIGRVLWSLLLIAGAVGVVLWLARHGRDWRITTAPATTDDDPSTVPADPPTPVVPPSTAAAPASGGALALAAGAGDVTRADAGHAGATDTSTSATGTGATGASAAGTRAPVSAAPPAPPQPPAGATDEELAAWRRSQDEWRRQRASWAAEQRRAERARRQERDLALARARYAENAARRSEWRARNPRVSRAYVGAAVGLAIAAGCSAVLVATASSPRSLGWSVGFGTAAVVLGLALAVAGLARRRPAGLTVFAILTLVAALGTAPLASDRLIVPWAGAAYLDSATNGRYLRVGGDTLFWLGTSPRVSTATVDIEQIGGTVAVAYDVHRTIRVVATLAAPELRLESDDHGPRRLPRTVGADGKYHYDLTSGPGPRPDLVLRVSGSPGVVTLQPRDVARDAAASSRTGPRSSRPPTPIPTPPSPTPTEGPR